MSDDGTGIDPPWRLDPFQNIVAFGIGSTIQLSLACALSNDNSHDPTTIVPGFTVQDLGNNGNIIAGADDFVGFEWFAPDGITNWAATAPAPAAQAETSSNIYNARATFLLSELPPGTLPLNFTVAINPFNVDDPAVYFQIIAQTTKFPGSSLLPPVVLSFAEADDNCNPLPMNTVINATINVDTNYNVTITVDDYDVQTINWLELTCYGVNSVPGTLESNYTVLSWTASAPLSPGGDITSTSSTAFYVTDDHDLTYAEAGLPEMAYRIPAFASPAPGQLAQIPPGDAVQGSLSSAFFNLDKLGVPFSVDLLVNGNYSGGDLALYYLQAQTYNAIPCQANVVLSTGIDNDKGTAVTLRVSVDADYNVSIAIVP